MNFYQREDYIEAKNQLRDEYAVCYQKAANYIHSFNYGSDHEENCLMLILDDFLSAQMENKPVGKITGPDLRKFCDSISNAEFSRSIGLRYYIPQMIAVFLLCAILLIAADALLLTGNMSWKDLNHMFLDGFVISFQMILLFIIIFKKLSSRILFHHIRISYAVNTILMLILYGITYRVALYLRKVIPVSIPIPLSLFIVLMVISIIILVFCGLITMKERKKYMLPAEVILPDQPEQVTCPSCGKLHDFDYPKCPHCKHKYIM